MTLFDEYEYVRCRADELKSKIDHCIEKWVEEHIGFISDDGELSNIGKTTLNSLYWEIDVDYITISYIVCKDRWMNDWTNENRIHVSFDEILEYETL